MNEKILKIKLGEILYWLFFGSLFLAKGLGFYDGQAVFKLILLLALTCLFLKICMESYTVSEYLKIIFILLLTGVTYLNSGEKGLVLCGLMMIGMKYVNEKRVFQIGTVIWSASFLFVTLTSLFHMEDTVYKVHSKLGLGHIFRWSLGYPHPNVLQVSYFILAVLIIYVLGERFKPKHALWLFAGNCLVFLYSVSYTGVIIFMVLILGRLYLYYRKKLSILEKGFLVLLYPVCVLMSLLAPVKMYGKWFDFFNKLLSTRMELGWWYLKPQNFTWFGLRVAEITDASRTMDNAYLFAFIAYGIIPFAVLSLGIMYATCYFLKKDQYMEALIITAIVIGGLTEPFLFNTSFKNLAFLFGGTLLFQGKKGRREFSLASKWNKEIPIPIHKIAELKAFMKRVISLNKKKCIAGAAGAVLLCIALQVFKAYPEGYVLHREVCADITKDFKYYEEENEVYADYKRVGIFQNGDLIEYYDGNIVRVEKLRDLAAAIVLGYAVGYFLTGAYCELADKKKRYERETVDEKG